MSNSKNLVLNPEVLKKIKIEPMLVDTKTMTVNGSIEKIAILGGLTFLSAFLTWQYALSTFAIQANNLYYIAAIGPVLGFLIAMAIIFKKEYSPYLAPVYCIVQGAFLGVISLIFETTYNGIVLQAILITFSMLFVLLILYRAKVIQATQTFKNVIFAATGSIFIMYLFSFAGMFFGFTVPFIHDNSVYGIIFSVIVVIVAALNLIIDFDFIEKGAAYQAPKYMEWYAGFGFMVSLIWLYLEILRLLAKSRSRK